MSVDVAAEVRRVVDLYDGDRRRLLSIVQALEERLGHLSEDAILALAQALGMHRVEVVDMVSFYAFFSRAPRGRFTIRLSRSPIAFMSGAQAVADALADATGAALGQTSPDGLFSLEWTADIGLADQEPSVLINGAALSGLRPADAREIVVTLRAAAERGPAMSGPDEVAALFPGRSIRPNVIQAGPVLLMPMARGAALRRALSMPPEAVIGEIARARLRGRGGAGFPTASKWRLCRQSAGETRYTICNADEGEPGTFKDRVILTVAPDLVFEGMTIAGYALGAREGIMYLRGEYAFLWSQLQRALAERRRLGLLGQDVLGLEGFDFDIRVQLGAGAYICGEESALIESLEGKRGVPRDRQYYPTERGYLQQPTAVNNVETLACVSRILERGGEWFAGFGTRESTGTKLLSLSGDCARPGVYEVPFGVTVNEVLDLAGAEDAQAVQVGGPSGQCLSPLDFGRQLSYEDLPTGGSTMVFGPQRDLLEVVRQFQQFFADESCGWCAPCRVGTTLLTMKLDKILNGRGTLEEVQALEQLGGTVERMSRCGLGQSAANPILSTLRGFPHLWEAKIIPGDFLPMVDLEQMLAPGGRHRAAESVP